MKNLFFLFLILASFISCSDSPKGSDSIKDELRTATPEAVMEETNFEGKSNDELADAACKCFEVLYQLRENAKKEYEAGDKDAYSKVDTDLKEERAKAKKCVRTVVKPIVGNDPLIEKFEQVLMKKCVHSYSNILLLSKIKFKPEE